MAISKKLILDNGVESKYHIVSLVNSKFNEDIEVRVSSFISKDYYSKAIKQNTLIKEKLKLDEEIDVLLKDESKIEEAFSLQTKSNELLNEISELPSFEEFITDNNTIYIPFKDGFDLDYIENELIKTDLFKNGKIVK